MIGYAILGLSIGLPLLLGLVFRVSSSHLFFSVMAGELLARYFGRDAESLAHSLAHNESVGSYAEIAILLAPMILTALLLRRTLSAAKAMLHTVPLAITGVVFAAFALPLLPDGLQDTIRSTQVGDKLLNLNSFIIGGVVVAQLLALWLLNYGEAESSKKRRKR